MVRNLNSEILFNSFLACDWELIDIFLIELVPHVIRVIVLGLSEMLNVESYLRRIVLV